MHLAHPGTLLLFLPAVWLVWWASARWGPDRLPTVVLLLASLGFYAWDHPEHLGLLLGSIVVNHALAGRLASSRAPGWLWAGIAANLGLLAAFKYSGFAVGTLRDLGLVSWSRPRPVLPLGLSFFTFQQIGLLVGAHQRTAPRTRLLDHALYVSFFPQLVAGPIVHHTTWFSQLGPTWRQREREQRAHRALGLGLVCVGLFKKTVVADSLAPMVDRLFLAGPGSAATAWTAALGYALQLFHDFGGYADIAVGVGFLFGLQLPVNFDAPYRATSLRAFWRRWHITLGAFLRDHLYLPLGGRRAGLGREWLALASTFVLGGLWHGAAWTFVLWGALHGACMMIGAGGRRVGLRLPPLLGWALTMLLVVAGWVLFRSPTASGAVDIWRAMLGMRGLGAPGELVPLLGTTALAGLTVAMPVAWRTLPVALAHRPRLTAVGCGILGLVGLSFATRTSAFLYFRF